MVFNWEKPVRNRYEDLLADAKQLSKEAPLVLETADVLQYCVRCDNIKGAVCKRQSVPPSDLHIFDLRKRRFELSGLTESGRGDSCLIGIALLQNIGPIINHVRNSNVEDA